MTRFVPSYAERYDEKRIVEMEKRHNVTALLARALIRRGIVSDEEIDRFLHAADQPLPDPYAFADMGKAVARIREAVLNDERICVYGDYDADGICATAILYGCLSELTQYARYYIPSRHDDGYGLNEAAINELSADGVTLIVTVDNGVSAAAEIAYAVSRGVDVIVTDHHMRQGAEPVCAAVLSAAALPGCSLCGAGVAFLLARALRPDVPPEKYLPLAAVATVADIVPLAGDNRTIVARGLPLIQTHLGLRALLAPLAPMQKAVTEANVAFYIAPRLNAAGRVGDAKKAVELLLCQNLADALSLAGELEAANEQRRALEAEIFEHARAQAAERRFLLDRALVLSGENWNVGVVGIVASKLAEQMHLPALVLCDNGDTLTGSGRSIPGINLFAALSACATHLTRFGGHGMAAGVTLEKGALEPFTRALQTHLTEQYDASAFQPTALYEEKLPLSALTEEAVRDLSRLAPFGEGNREPLYLLERLRFSDVRAIGRNKQHVSANGAQGRVALRCVGFGLGRLSGILATGGAFDAVGTCSINAFNGTTLPELYLQSVRRSPDGQEKNLDAFWKEFLYNTIYMQKWGDFSERLRPYTKLFAGLEFSREREQALYRALQAFLLTGEAFADDLIPLLTAEQVAALLVFVELGFFFFDPARASFSVPAKVRQSDLKKSRLYEWLGTL